LIVLVKSITKYLIFIPPYTVRFTG
jgi:hypothetical protein